MRQSLYLFEERQRFRQWWLWVLLAATQLPMAAILVYQLWTGQQVGDRPAPNIILVLLLLLVSVPLLLGFYYATLTTRITEEGIFFGWNFPTGKLKKVPWSRIRECRVIRYRFVGYGYRLATAYGTVYNVKGTTGLHIITENGAEFLLGTAKPEEMRAVLTASGRMK